MRLSHLFVLFASTGLGACATALPAGARPLGITSRGEPLGPPALARYVPAPVEPPPAPIQKLPPLGSRRELVRLASSLVGHSSVRIDGQRYSDDCTGLVTGLFAHVGLTLNEGARAGDNGVTAIYRFAQTHGRVYQGGHPLAGDLVFFRETYDQNLDGRVNDGLTHVGVVESELPDRTVVVIHRVKSGVVRYRMNLDFRNEHSDPSGHYVLNDVLRFAGSNQQVLTGQLFAAYASILPVESVAAR